MGWKERASSPTAKRIIHFLFCAAVRKVQCGTQAVKGLCSWLKSWHFYKHFLKNNSVLEIRPPSVQKGCAVLSMGVETHQSIITICFAMTEEIYHCVLARVGPCNRSSSHLEYHSCLKIFLLKHNTRAEKCTNHMCRAWWVFTKCTHLGDQNHYHQKINHYFYSSSSIFTRFLFYINEIT